MTTITRSAAGASAYSRVDSVAVPLLEEYGSVGLNTPDQEREGWSTVIDGLLRIRNIKDNWDGQGTEAPHPSLVDGAITLAQTLQSKGLTPPDRVFASVNSTVYFEWHTPLGYCEIEVVSPVEAEGRTVLKGARVAEAVYFYRR